MGNFLIVGNTSGIGKELSEHLMSAGNTVFAINRRPTESATQSFCADVTIDPLPAIVAPLDGIAYCPGSITLKPFRGLKQEDIMKDMQVNLMGAVRVLQQYLPNLKMAAHPSVVLFSTVAVTTGMPYHASIAMAKGAVEGLVRSLAAEWAPTIRVNCIAPSLTDTPLAAKLLETDAKREAGAARHPLKTVGRSEDIARAAMFLLGDSSRFVTGQVLHIDGGMSSVRM
jgi:3-oxoacyl-[acyl-carrier protein] reductase